MKELYERPMITVEEFTVNRAIASCSEDNGRDIVFDCMIGPIRDVENVLTDNCRRKAGTTTLTKAGATNSHNHSNVTRGTWGTMKWNNQTMRTYTAPEDATGLIYFCTYTNGTSCFSVEGDRLIHTVNHDSPQYHVEVAPVYGPKITDVNTGS